MSERLRASILVIGDEILGGFVQDTNSGWLARRLQRLGIPLERIVTVPDELDAIAEGLGSELGRRRPRLLLTCGGIGSTPDDLTMEAVARHLGLALVIDPTIAARVRETLAATEGHGMALSAGHRRSMLKMARVPEGAYLLEGAQGVASGVAVDVDGGAAAPQGATVAVLPGIPSELQRIVLHGLEPTILRGRGEPEHVAEARHGYPESTINPLLSELVAAYPELHVGSYPGRECVVRLKGPRGRVEEAIARVEDYLAELDRDPGAQRLRRSWQARWDEPSNPG